jgi:hypothetical protein
VEAKKAMTAQTKRAVAALALASLSGVLLFSVASRSIAKPLAISPAAFVLFALLCERLARWRRGAAKNGKWQAIDPLLVALGMGGGLSAIFALPYGRAWDLPKDVGMSLGIALFGYAFQDKKMALSLGLAAIAMAWVFFALFREVASLLICLGFGLGCLARWAVSRREGPTSGNAHTQEKAA